MILIGCRKDLPKPEYLECYSEITSVTKAYFEKDAIYLAFDEVRNDSTNIYHNNPEIPEEIVQFYLSKLSAIYKSSIDVNSEIHDLFFKYQLHHLLELSLSKMAIWFNPDLVLRNQFVNDPANTQSEVLNEFHTKYGFTYLYVSGIGSPELIYVDSKSLYNTEALAKILIEVDDIEIVFPRSEAQYTSKVYVEHFDFYEEFTFVKTWSNILFDEHFSHYWKVKVDNDCQVTLTDEFGDELPE